MLRCTKPKALLPFWRFSMLSMLLFTQPQVSLLFWQHSVSSTAFFPHYFFQKQISSFWRHSTVPIVTQISPVLSLLCHQFLRFFLILSYIMPLIYEWDFSHQLFRTKLFIYFYLRTVCVLSHVR
jgi:hypothetical protein